MKIEITKFRTLIEQRQELLKQAFYERLTVHLGSAEKLQIKVKEIEKQIWPETNHAQFKINKFFFVPKNFIDEKIKAYFEEKNIDVEYVTTELINSTTNIYLKVPFKQSFKEYLLYNTSEFDGYANKINLKCLHGESGEYSWDVLIEDFPELKDVLWDLAIEYHNKQKIERVGLIEQMIKKNQEELDMLMTPMKIERRITEICYELDDGEKELKQLEESLNEVEI